MDDIRWARDPERLKPFWKWLNLIPTVTALLLEVFRSFTNVAGNDFQPDFRLAQTRHAIEPKHFATELKLRGIVRAASGEFFESQYFPVETHGTLVLMRG